MEFDIFFAIFDVIINNIFNFHIHRFQTTNDYHKKKKQIGHERFECAVSTYTKQNPTHNIFELNHGQQNKSKLKFSFCFKKKYAHLLRNGFGHLFLGTKEEQKTLNKSI